MRRILSLQTAALCAYSLALALAGLLALEAALRAGAPAYLIEQRGLLVFSEAYGWALRKGTDSVFSGSHYTINHHGYRDRELAVPRRDRRTRVAVLGDSIAF